MHEHMDSQSALILDPVLDLRAAAPLRDAFLERRGAPLMVDASRVEQVGGLCLQVLLSARHAWLHDHMAFGFSEQSGAFRKSLEAFGASGFFDQASLAE